MIVKAYEQFCGLVSRLFSKSISQKQLSRICMVLMIGMMVPLFVIALYNYPADDDFGFVLPVATAWVQTGSLGEVFKAVLEKNREMYTTWQGNFSGTAHISMSPMIFNQNLYFIANWGIMLELCLTAAYLVKGIVCRLLKASRQVFWIVYTALMILVIQFMPSVSDGIMWHTGTVYTAPVCWLFLALGILIRCIDGYSGFSAAWRYAVLFVLGMMLGGGSFGPMLGALVFFFMLTVYAFFTRSRSRTFCLAACIGCVLGMIISVSAPGNLVRMERTGEMLSPLSTVITAVLDSFDVTGRLLSPQLLAMLLLITAALWRPLKGSSFRFAHPFWVFIMLYGLFSATIAPAIYTQTEYASGRYFNAVYLYFLLFAAGSTVYAEGWLIRKLESSQKEEAAHLLKATENLGKRFSAAFLALVIALTAFGGFEFTIMNTSSVSALKSLVTGEAAQFRADMAERQEYIRVTDSDVVAVQPLGSQPYVFKRDRLPFQGIYGRVRYMKWYFELFYNAENESAS